MDTLKRWAGWAGANAVLLLSGLLGLAKAYPVWAGGIGLAVVAVALLTGLKVFGLALMGVAAIAVLVKVFWPTGETSDS